MIHVFLSILLFICLIPTAAVLVYAYWYGPTPIWHPLATLLLGLILFAIIGRKLTP